MAGILPEETAEYFYNSHPHLFTEFNAACEGAYRASNALRPAANEKTDQQSISIIQASAANEKTDQQSISIIQAIWRILVRIVGSIIFAAKITIDAMSSLCLPGCVEGYGSPAAGLHILCDLSLC